MTTISNYSSLNLNVPLTEEQIAANKEVDGQQSLGQDDFFALLSQQLAYQDPFKPVDNAEMIAQMASFTTAEGVTSMGDSITGMTDVLNSSQALQASSLVGKRVLIPTNEGYLAEQGELSGSISTTTGAYSTMVTIEDQAGSVIRSISLGDIGAGNQGFSWDGLDAQGNRMPAGRYTLKANGLVNGQGEELTTATYAHVESVSLGGGQAGINLNLQGLGGIKLSDAIEVAETK